MRWLVLLCIFRLTAADHLEVGEVAFEGRTMVLSKGIRWDHDLGTIEAKAAEAFFDEETCQEITIQEGVKMTMSDGGTLRSPYAWLGLRQCMAIFHGTEGNKIFYEKPQEELSIKSLRMELFFIPQEPIALERLKAEEAVEIAMEKDLHMTSDSAVFDQFLKGTFGKVETFGDPCVLTQDVSNELINSIASRHVTFHLREQTLEFDEPEGKIHRDKIPLHFKAKKLFVDRLKEHLVLDPPVEIQWMGRLKTEGKVEMTQKNKLLQSVFIQGPAELDWEQRYLAVPGTISIDPVDKKMELRSGNDQVFFKDDLGTIYADRVYLDFNDDLKPVKMVLEGNVRLENKASGASQYALADEATVEFGTNTLHLASKDTSNVLFYDELNKIQASAPALVVNRDPKTHQNALRGIGHVRFIFAEEELNELKKRFSLEIKK